MLDRGRPGDRQIRQDLVQPVGVLGGQLQVVVRALPGIYGEKSAAVQEVRAQAITQPGERRWRCFTILFRETQQPSQPFRLAVVALDHPTAPAGAASSSFGARIGQVVDEGVGVCAVPLPSEKHTRRQHGRAGEEPTSPVFNGLDGIMACNDLIVVRLINPGRGGPPKANVVVGDGLPKPVERWDTLEDSQDGSTPHNVIALGKIVQPKKFERNAVQQAGKGVEHVQHVCDEAGALALSEAGGLALSEACLHGTQVRSLHFLEFLEQLIAPEAPAARKRPTGGQFGQNLPQVQEAAPHGKVSLVHCRLILAQ